MIVDNKKALKRKGDIKKVVLNSHYRKEQEDFIRWLDRLGYAKSTVRSHSNRIVYFFSFLQQQGIHNYRQITFHQIEAYYQIISLKPISVGYLRSYMSTIERFCKYLELLKSQKIYYKDLIGEKYIAGERNILTQAEVKFLFSSLENTPQGLLHRALLHVYYSCGLRASEGMRLLPKHINYQAQLLYVVPGKNYEGRYVPFSGIVAKELGEYEKYGRPLINTESPFFLVAPYTDAMNHQLVSSMLHKMLKKITIPKRITLHCLRHSIATHLLQSGMDLESISKFLGHRTLDATQIYVHINSQMIYDTQQTF